MYDTKALLLRQCEPDWEPLWVWLPQQEHAAQIAELYYDLAAAKSCLMQLYGVILPARAPDAQPPAAPAAQQVLQPVEHQARHTTQEVHECC